MRPAVLIEQLRGLRTRFDRPGRTRRLELLRAAGRLTGLNGTQLVELHELLLFVCCYPDDRVVLRAAEQGLDRLAVRAAELGRRNRGDRDAEALDDSGIAGTNSVVSLSFSTVVQLLDRYPADLEIDWDEDGSAGERLDTLLELLTAVTERDGLLRTDLSTRDWFDRARGRRAAVAVLLERIGQAAADRQTREQLFEAADVSLRWQLRGASRTRLRFPPRPLHAQVEPPARGVDVQAILVEPLPRSSPLSRPAARRLIDAALDTLAVRHRETDPVTYANEREITLFHLDRGIDVALLGMQPDARLPIESFFGYVAARNRVPVAYGGGWVWGDRCEIGVNVFDTFRGGESALIFATILRVYHQHYGARRFLVDPFQFGAGNDEAIASGAFWFYHRLGFRPTEPRLARLAEAEAARLVAEPGRRTPPATLKRLAGATLALPVGDADDRRSEAPDVTRLGTAVTAMIGRRFGGDAARAQAWATARVERLCGLKAGTMRTPAEKGLCLLAARIERLRSWTPAERRSLGRLIRAKAGPRERDYALAVRRHPRWLDALRALAAADV